MYYLGQKFEYFGCFSLVTQNALGPSLEDKIIYKPGLVGDGQGLEMLLRGSWRIRSRKSTEPLLHLVPHDWPFYLLTRPAEGKVPEWVLEENYTLII